MVIIDSVGNALVDWTKENIEKYIKEEKPVTQAAQFNPALGFNTPTYQGTPTLHQGEFDMFGRRTGQTNVFSQVPKTQNSTDERVPLELRAQGVDYEPETDMYYSDEPASGFTFNRNWGCFICYGEEVRKRYNITKTGKPKKNNKTNNKKKGS